MNIHMKLILTMSVFLLLSVPVFAAKPKKAVPAPKPSSVPLSHPLKVDPNAVYFRGLGSTLDVNAVKKLTQVTQTLTKYRWNDIQLVAHAYRCKDAKVCTAIEAQRNAAVKGFLVKHGIKPYKINTIAFGDSIHPGPGDTPYAQALQQKVEVLIR